MQILFQERLKIFRWMFSQGEHCGDFVLSTIIFPYGRSISTLEY